MSILPHTTTPQSWTARQLELLAGIEALFVREGFRSTTLADLSRRLKCSRRTLYDLAPTKDDLVATVVGRFLDQNYATGVAAMEGAADARRRLEAFATAVVNDARRSSLDFAADIYATPRTADLLARYDQRCVSLIENVIRAGQETDEFRDLHAGLAAEAIMAAIARVQNNTVLTVVNRTYGQAVHELVDLFLDGLSR